MKIEIPIVVEIDAEDRSAAEQRACDIADGLGGVWPAASATAVVSVDHELLERLGIAAGGVSGVRFEIPLVLELGAESREDAEGQACDIADALGDVFDGCSATAILSTDHNLLERLRIAPGGALVA